MYYRSLIWSLISIAIAVAMMALWIQAVSPLGHSPMPATAPRAWPTAAHRPPAAHQPPVAISSKPGPAVLNLARVWLLLAFVVLCTLLTVSMILTVRSLLLGYQAEKFRKTTYVDAWKLAGKRLRDKPSDDDP